MTDDEIRDAIGRAFREAMEHFAGEPPPMRMWIALGGFVRGVCGACSDDGNACPVFDMYGMKSVGVRRDGLDYGFRSKHPMDRIFLEVNIPGLSDTAEQDRGAP